MNPSTMNLARRSSRATWRITAGFRYFSAVPATRSLLTLRPEKLDAAAPSSVGGGLSHPHRTDFPRDRRATRPKKGSSTSGAVVLGRIRLSDLTHEPLDQ